MNLSQKRELCGKQVTLNDTPAVVCGAIGPFAYIRSLTKPISGEWAWETVARIVSKDGKFRA